jgi:Family of unknown function (DUF6516)
MQAALLRWWCGKCPNRCHPRSIRSNTDWLFVRDNQRVVGYDNERGKGDHKHLGERELQYRFVDIETLMADFLRDVEALQ